MTRYRFWDDPWIRWGFVLDICGGRFVLLGIWYSPRKGGGLVEWKERGFGFGFEFKFEFPRSMFGIIYPEYDA